MSAGGRVTGRVLVIEDDRAVRAGAVRVLQRDGHTVFQTESAEEALRKLAALAPDVIVADIKLGGMSGVDFLREVRVTDLDLPVILWTGDLQAPAVLDGRRLGALDVIEKGVGTFEKLVEAVMRGLRLRALTKTVDVDGVRDELQQTFAAALADAWMVAQPIVDPRSRTIIGQELLLRTSTKHFANTGEFVEASQKLKAIQVLAHRVRSLVAKIIEEHPENRDQLFVNVDPSCLDETALYAQPNEDGNGVQNLLAPYARRITLEITERAPVEEVPDLRERLASLRRIGYQIAIDDFGAGHATLGLLTRVEPDILKLDMSLIRGIHLPENAKRKHVVKKTIELAHELGMTVIAEGIEVKEERDVMESLLVDGLQGFGIAYPALPFNSILLP